jgi:uroporphyrinogen-III decarboxylase
MILYGKESTINAAVKECIQQAKGKHVLNIGIHLLIH